MFPAADDIGSVVPSVAAGIGGGAPLAAADAIVFRTLRVTSLVMTFGLATIVLALGFQTLDRLQKGRRSVQPKGP